MNGPDPTGARRRPGADPEADAVRIGISACLLGEEVRFDGGHKRDPFLLQTVGPLVTWVPVCPEVEAGLGVPREAVRLVRRPGGRPRVVGSRTGTDRTDAMEATAATMADRLRVARLDGFILKKSSPSCGLHGVRVYPDGDGAPSADGRGIFAAALVDRLPLLPVEEEGRLNDPGLREAFYDQVFTHRRWRAFLEAGPTPGALVDLHARHKMTLLAHDPARYRRMGRLVAGAGAGDLDAIVEEYGHQLFAALRVPPTRGRHANVLQHLLGFVSDRLDAGDRSELVEVIEDHRRGLVPLVVPVTLLRHHLLRGGTHEWARSQTYLSPYPKELLLRNHV